MMRAHERPRANGAHVVAEALQAVIPVLTAGDLVLRAPRLDDFDIYAEIVCSDRADPMGGPMSRDEAWDDFARMTATWIWRGHGVWAVTRETRVLGFVLIGFEPGDEEPELGYLFRAEAEGKGIAARAARAVLDYAKGKHGVDSLVSYIAPENTRSIALARKLGARMVGMLDGTEIWRHLPAGQAGDAASQRGIA